MVRNYNGVPIPNPDMRPDWQTGDLLGAGDRPGNLMSIQRHPDLRQWERQRLHYRLGSKTLNNRLTDMAARRRQRWTWATASAM